MKRTLLAICILLASIAGAATITSLTALPDGAGVFTLANLTQLNERYELEH